MKDVLQEITRLRLERHWTEYELAKRAELPQSTISTWFRKHQTPTIQSLEKIAEAFGLTLSQFFAGDGEAIYLTAEQKELLDRWAVLTEQQRRLALELLRTV